MIDIIAFVSIMYDKRNKMENIYLMLYRAFFFERFSWLCFCLEMRCVVWRNVNSVLGDFILFR